VETALSRRRRRSPAWIVDLAFAERAKLVDRRRGG
jgi:hypothetical protein